MRMKQLTLIAVIDGLDAVVQETTCGALAGQVRARIARRPGRWRARMHSAVRAEERAPVRPEAA
jgi:hypothetical protein